MNKLTEENIARNQVFWRERFHVFVDTSIFPLFLWYHIETGRNSYCWWHVIVQWGSTALLLGFISWCRSSVPEGCSCVSPAWWRGTRPTRTAPAPWRTSYRDWQIPESKSHTSVGDFSWCQEEPTGRENSGWTHENKSSVHKTDSASCTLMYSDDL